MRRSIHLYINGAEADISEQGLVLFNYTRDEASNPSVIKNSYSQDVTLPPTAKNKAIMGHYGRLDRITPNGGFNALLKASFRITNDMGEILESGYAKLVSIGADGSYKISLFGGLGEFFYSLSYKEDGSRKRLSDLLVYDEDAEEYKPMSSIYFTATRANVADMWDNLSQGLARDFSGLVNFAPCLNGYPSCKFSADKAVYRGSSSPAYQYEGVYTSADGYSTRTGADGHILLAMKDKHTEWEVQDLRAYLQRPVVNVLEMLKTIAASVNTGDYTLALDSGFFSSANGWIKDLWLTMPMFDRDKVSPTTAKMSDIITIDLSPAEMLIGIAKTFGLSFLFDKTTKTITLCSRNAYYTDEVEDISSRVDTEREQTPVLAEAKNYIFSPSTIYGQFAKDYDSKYGKQYGSRWVNTGYDFEGDPVKVFDNYPFKGCPDVRESSAGFQVFGGRSLPESEAYENYYFKFTLMEEVKWTLYGTDEEGKETSQDFGMTDVPHIASIHYDGQTDSAFRHFLTLPQLHGEEQKAEDGAGVLLYYCGMRDIPYGESYEITFHLSDDSAAMLLLNDGEPCWDASILSPNVTDVAQLPLFRRWQEGENGIIRAIDFGKPQEVQNDDDPDESVFVYNNFWKNYIADKYDMDTKAVNVKVDWSGVRVTEELLRKFYHFADSLWVLNAVKNHSLTTHDMTECEFIQVKDKDDYIDGQTI